MTALEAKITRLEDVLDLPKRRGRKMTQKQRERQYKDLCKATKAFIEEQNRYYELVFKNKACCHAYNQKLYEMITDEKTPLSLRKELVKCVKEGVLVGGLL